MIAHNAVFVQDIRRWGLAGNYVKPVGGLDHQQGLAQDQSSSRVKMQLSLQEHPPTHIHQSCVRDSVRPEDIEVS